MRGKEGSGKIFSPQINVQSSVRNLQKLHNTSVQFTEKWQLLCDAGEQQVNEKTENYLKNGRSFDLHIFVFVERSGFFLFPLKATILEIYYNIFATPDRKNNG